MHEQPRLNVYTLTDRKSTIAVVTLLIGGERITCYGSSRRMSADTYDAVIGDGLAVGRALDRLQDRLGKRMKRKVAALEKGK
jgi:hypothetical protein